MLDSVKAWYAHDAARRYATVATCFSLLALSVAGAVQLSAHFEEPSPKTGASASTEAWPSHLLQSSGDPGLHELTTMSNVFQGRLPDSLMFFTGMPRSMDEVPDDARMMAATLKTYKDAGVRPLIIMEPNSSGQPIPLSDIASGQLDPVLQAYYQMLKAQGVTDAMMGQWTVLPEANTPAWDTTDPVTVREGIIHVAQAQKAVFPGSEVSIMLDSQTYPTQDWSAGSYASLVPYVQGIPSGLVDSFGLQGFPWVDPGASATSLDMQSPHTYLSARMALEAAAVLGVHKIWFNTGTFASMHDGAAGEVTISPEQRRELFVAVNQEITYARTLGYDVTVNIFAEDKSQAFEATDWSYHRSADDKVVLSDFIKGMRSAGVHIAFFDDGTPGE